MEIHEATCQRSMKYRPETEQTDSAKVDDDTFQKQIEYMNKKLAEIEKSKQGTISA